MARPLRIEYPGAYYHVMNRGNNKQNIFFTDKDRKSFLQGLAESSDTYGVKVFAFVMMNNHFHLIVQTGEPNLSEFMRHFLVTYTVRFNKRRNRTGHLFQGRYKSILVEQDAYLLPLTRYIHLNPIRKKEFEFRDHSACEKYLLEYQWSSLPGYVTKKNRQKYVEYDWLLKTYFKGDTSKGRKRYWKYICEGIRGEIENPFEKVMYQSILGSDFFVHSIKEEITFESEREVPSLRKIRRSLPLEFILKEISKRYGMQASVLLTQRTAMKHIRDIAMELSYRYCQVTLVELGEIFGIDYSTVSLNRSRLKELLKSDHKMRREFEALEKRLAKYSKLKM
jgi:REP element-mobilizing transposase RayT